MYTIRNLAGVPSLLIIETFHGFSQSLQCQDCLETNHDFLFLRNLLFIHTPNSTPSKLFNWYSIVATYILTDHLFTVTHSMKCIMKGRGREVCTPVLYWGSPCFDSQLSWVGVFVVFLSVSRKIFRQYLKRDHSPLSSTSLPIHHS
jgi:hypothetical protein